LRKDGVRKLKREVIRERTLYGRYGQSETQVMNRWMTKSFEDIDVWKQAMQLAYLTRVVLSSAQFKGDIDLKSQMRRAAVSIPSNIAEGYEKGYSKDSIRFYRIAKGSVGELRTQIILCRMGKELPLETCEDLLTRAISVSRSLGGFIRHLQSRA
jgi:four helix bundle protein